MDVSDGDDTLIIMRVWDDIDEKVDSNGSL